jgi:RimJ/RimL family protein N-acetyltransferase
MAVIEASPIETSRLRFCGLKHGDEKYLFPEIDEALTQHWIGWEPPETIDEVREKIEQSLELSKTTINVEWLVFDKETGDFVGLCNLIPYEEHPGELDIGLWIKASAQGHGYGGEMLHALLSWAEANLAVPYIVYSVTEGNERSAKIIRHLNAPVLREFTATKRGQERKVTDYKVALHSSVVR